MNENSQDRVWFITGCSSGLGRALAERVLARGGRVVASARQPERLQDLVDRHPDRCRAMALDVTVPGQVAAGVAQAAAAFGRLDVIVNNAGCGLIGALEDLDDGRIARHFAVNFLGALRVIRATLPILRGQGRGHYVAVSAAAAIANYPGFSVYGASKAALESAMESLAAEVRPLGIKVTIVQPGPLRTRFLSGSLERVAPTVADYDATCGKFLRLLEAMDGRQPGDPGRAADAIMAAVESPAPPLRLVLGKYAIEKARRTLAAAGRELEKWSETGLAIDGPAREGAPHA